MTFTHIFSIYFKEVNCGLLKEDQDFPVAQTVKKLSAMQETRVVPSLSWEVPLEKRLAIHSSILVGRIPWTEKPGGLQSVGLQSRA